ncbi:hypothetical protein Syun_014682 [Stephania yunnanensis]|uniref:Uncharacterized protein n=1 Tax=Stephania yunnanensis TaxID=152371 RepID=A0AAP0P914_9MAGN
MLYNFTACWISNLHMNRMPFSNYDASLHKVLEGIIAFSWRGCIASLLNSINAGEGTTNSPTLTCAPTIPAASSSKKSSFPISFEIGGQDNEPSSAITRFNVYRIMPSST